MLSIINQTEVSYTPNKSNLFLAVYAYDHIINRILYNFVDNKMHRRYRNT